MQLTVDDFDGRNLKNTEPIAVLFEAKWCPFCREFTSIFESLRQTKLLFAIVDISDLDDPLWETFDISIVPTVLLFKSGKVIQRYDGVAGEGLNGVIVNEIILKLHSLQNI